VLLCYDRDIVTFDVVLGDACLKQIIGYLLSMLPLCLPVLHW
jgi:hypothetical protein